MKPTTRKEEMREQAEKFHRENPEVWKLFCRFTFQLIARGFKHYSAQHGVFSRIRWETDQADVDGKSMFKINNNHSAFYARWFMESYPEHDGFYRTRAQTSGDEAPTNLPPLTPSDFPYGPLGYGP
jgi:hypothetical protein